MIRPAPGIPVDQQSEQVVMRMCLADEVRGEKDASGDLDAFPMLAVWHVIRNRALKKDKTMKAIVLEKAQFSGFNELGGHRDQMLMYWQTDPIAWSRADAVCDIAERGSTIDPTSGALNYYNPTIAQPAWGRGHPGWKEHVMIDSHAFGIAG